MSGGEDPGLHVVADGFRVMPRRTQEGWVFAMDAPVRAARLVSKAAIPAVMGLSEDRRLLGFALQRLVLRHDGGEREFPLASDELIDGFHPSEPAGFRWANGNAGLPDSLFADVSGPVALTIAGFGLPRYGAADPISADDRELFLAFENLGEDCEFAFAQSRYGVEPAGLLRWASTTLPQLEAGLATRFRDLGDPAYTHMEWRRGTGEYRWNDSRYLQAHTGLTTRSPDPAQEPALRDRTTARLLLLRRKFLADVAAGEKIFIFKSCDPAATPTDFRRLHAALRAIAPTRLLCVRLAGESETPASVDHLGDGLMIGRLDRFVRDAGPYDCWRALCRAARAAA